VDLDVLLGHVGEGLGAVRRGERRGHRKFGRFSGSAGNGVVDRGTGGLDLAEQVGTLVLDRLERPDRPVELHPDLRVLHRGVQARPCPTELFGGQRDHRQIERLAQKRRRVTLRADPHGRGAVEIDPAQPARQVECVEPNPCHARRISFDGEQSRSRVGARDDEQQIGRVTVDDEHLGAGHRPALADGHRRGRPDVFQPPRAGLLRNGHGRGQ
jgi:hypothetical protein